MTELLGYLFIILAVVSGTAKGYCGKRVSDRIADINDAINVNFIRSVACFIIALPFALGTGAGELFSIGAKGMLICILSGVTMGAFIISWVFAVKSGAYMLVSAFCAASFIVPYIFGIASGEKLTLFKIVSVVLILAALFFMEKYNLKLKGSIRLVDLLVLFFVLIMQGINQVTQKMFTDAFADKNVNIYTFYTFVFTALALLIAKPFFMKKRDKNEPKRHVARDNIGYIIVMAVFLFANSAFMTLASKSVASIVLYPVSNALSLAAGGIMSAICFREKPSVDYVIGILLVLLGTVASKF